jgi:hypothetical protein
MSAPRPLAWLAPRICAAHLAATAGYRRGLEQSIAAGSLLLEAKDQLDHGEWMPWLLQNCAAIPGRTARRYMRLAENRSRFEENGHVAILAVREALDLVAGTATGLKRRNDPGNLAEPFLVPPFTVIDTRTAEWQARKRAWLALGIQPPLAPLHKLAFNQSGINKMERHRRDGLAAVMADAAD